MLSIPKIISYVNNESIESDIIKDYFEKSSAGLKNLNKRSIRITQFIIVLVIFNLFQKNFNHVKIFENDIDIKLLRLLTPTFISYMLFEWLMMAKRRRDLIFGIQQATYKLFKIKPTASEAVFPGFNPNTLNLMPYSLMCEVLSIYDKSGYNRRIYLFAIKFLFVTLVIIMGISFYGYWKASDFVLCVNWPTSFQVLVETISFYATLLTTLLFIGWIIYYYCTEFKNRDEIIKSNLQ